ncbi:MAG: hypothetical protein ACHP9Y_04010 [Gammaproteobacteria bacterium]
MPTNQQNLICLAIIIVVVLAVGWMGRNPPLEPAGLLSLNGSTPALNATPYSLDEVKVYQMLPLGAKVEGEITVELIFDPNENEQEQVQKLLGYARTRVGAAGANGSVVDMVAQRGSVWYFAGKVIKV